MSPETGAERYVYRTLDKLFLVSSVLVLPLAFLLFAQWPLREWVQAWSRQANDLAQILFAMYVAVAITAASRANSHLAVVKPTAGQPRRPNIWRAGLLLVCVGPWALFMLWAAMPTIVSSVVGFEKFGETTTPGYFSIKLALGLLLVLILMEAVVSCFNAWRHKS
ncbi:MAG: C4-dicarboxylate ABC transporter substrate-binding protein [Comamonadaceae bacterium]